MYNVKEAFWLNAYNLLSFLLLTINLRMNQEFAESFQDDPHVPEATVIYTLPQANTMLLLGALGALLYMVYFFMQSNYAIGGLLLLLAAWFTLLYMQQNKPRPILILQKDGLQEIGKPLIPWELLYGVKIKSEVKNDKYVEALVFAENGRIREFPLHKLTIKSWQLEHLLAVYQGRYWGTSGL